MTDASFPKISVALSHYNQAGTLAQSLESVCSQDPPPYEVLLLDDCSTDGSMAIIEEFARKYPFFRYIRYPEKSAEWNKAFCEHVHLLTGDYVLMFAGDDVIYPGFFRAASDALQRFPPVGVVFSSFHHATKELQVFGVRMHGFHEPCLVQGELLNRQLCRPWIVEGGIAALIRRDALMWLVGRNAHEFGMWLDSMGYAVVALKHGAIYLPDVYGCVRVHGETFSSSSSQDEAKAMRLFQAVRSFLRSPELESFVPPVVAAALEQKCLVNSHPSVAQRYSAEPLLAEANRYLAAQMLPDACRVLQQIAQSCPGVPEVYVHLGRVYFGLKQYAEAEKAFGQALLNQPEDAALHSNLGVCMHAQGRPDEAIWCYYQALRLNGDFADAHANLASACASMGRIPEAIQSCRQALRLAPQHANAQAQLQRLLTAFPQLA